MSISIGLYPNLDLWNANKLDYITQNKSNDIEKHNRPHLRMLTIHTSNFAYKMFWPKRISSEQDHTVNS